MDRFEAIFMIGRNEPKEDVTLGITQGGVRVGVRFRARARAAKG